MFLPRWIRQGLRNGRYFLARMQEDDLLVYAAAVAYSFLFALFPLMLFVIALVGFLHVPLQPAALERGPLRQVVPESVLTYIANAWQVLSRERHPTLLSLGALGFVTGMSSVFRQLIEALNHAYQFPLPRRRPWWITYALSVLAGSTAGLAIALVWLGVTISPAFIATLVRLALGITVPLAAIAIARWLFLGTALWLITAALYHYLPDQPRPFRICSPGVATTLIMWFLASLAFSFYVDRVPTYHRLYGSLGGLILLLLYLYWAALALVVGAEVSALTESRGSPQD
ncbi:MAG: YihY/virulence factor BrkB family protein [Firmicutes bacterium]|nr:YihY/virulence factor BrkB family protein [Bacillota bacterium]